MKISDLHELPKVRDKLSYLLRSRQGCRRSLYVEHCLPDRSGSQGHRHPRRHQAVARVRADFYDDDLKSQEPKAAKAKGKETRRRLGAPASLPAAQNDNRNA